MPDSAYQQLREFIINSLSERGELTINDLIEAANREFHSILGENTTWYLLKVKLDMEARGDLRVRKPSQIGVPLLRLAGKARL